MPDLKQVNDALNYYIRPQTFPLAVRMLSSEEELPKRARLPKRDLGTPVTVCQAVGIARRYGWTLAIGDEDQVCPFGSLALGFAPAKPGYLDGSFAESQEAGSGKKAARTAQEMKKLEFGKYAYLLLSPLHNATFEPHFLLIYGNSAQVMRLVQGRLQKEGGFLKSSAAGSYDCSDIVCQTLLSEECQFILPCNGDRILGMTQDHEMAFTMPLSKVEQVINSLEASHRTGLQRYPIPSFLMFTPQLPPSYNKLMEFLKQED